MSVHESRHPLVRHKIGLLRQAETGPKLFRELSAELATLLTYEALRDLRPKEKRSGAGPARLRWIISGWTC